MSVRRVLKILTAVSLVGLALLVVPIALLQLPSVSNWTGQKLLGLVPLDSAYTLHVGRITGNWLTHLELHDVALERRHPPSAVRHPWSERHRPPSETLIELRRVEARYSPLELVRLRLRLLRISEGRVLLQRDSAGWELAHAFGTPDSTAPPTQEKKGDGFAVEALDLRDVHVMSGLAPDSGLDVRRLAGAIARDVIRLDTLDVQSAKSRLAGRAVIPRQINDPRQLSRLYANLRAAPLALSEVARYTDAVVPRGELNALIDVTANDGRANAAVTATLGNARLELTGSSLISEDAPLALQLEGKLTGLDPARVLRNAPAGIVTGTVSAELEGERLTKSNGDIAIKVEQRGRLEVDATAKVTDGQADLVLRGNMKDIALNATGTARPFDAIPSYRLRGDAQVGERSGRFALVGSGITPATLDALAQLDVDSLKANVTVEAGNALVRVGGRYAGGDVTVLAQGKPFEPVIAVAIDSAVLEGADLSRLTGNQALKGPITVRAKGKGRLGDEMEAQLDATVDPTTLRGVSIKGGGVTIEMKGERVQIEGNLLADGGTIVFDGDADSVRTTPRFTARGEIDSLNAAVLLGRADLPTRISARFEAEGRGADQLAADVQLLASRVRQAQLGPGTIHVARAAGQLSARVAISQGDLRINTRLTPDSARGELELRRLDRWLADSTLGGVLHAMYDVTWSRASGRIVGAAGTVVARGNAGALRLDSLHVALAPGRGFALDTLFVRSNVLTADGGGRDTIRVVAYSKDAAPLARATDLDVSLDSVRVAMSVTGPPDHRSLSGEAEAWRLLYSGTLVEQARATVATNLVGARPDSLVGSLDLRGLASGNITLRYVQAIVHYDSMFLVQGSAGLSRDITVTTIASGASGEDGTVVDLQRLDLAEGGRKWALTGTAHVESRRRRISVTGFNLRSETGFLVMDGVINLNGESNFGLITEGLDLREFATEGIVPIDGVLEGSVSLEGPTASPNLVSTLAVTLPRRGEGEPGTIRSQFWWSRRELELRVSADGGQGTFSVDGTLPWGFSLGGATGQGIAFPRQRGDTLMLRVQADTFGIGLFEPFLQGVDNLGGFLMADATIAGTPEQPLARGALHITQLALEIPQIDVKYNESYVAAKLDGTEVQVDSLLVQTGRKKWLTAQGRIQLKPLTDPGVDVTLTLNDFVIANKGMLEGSATGQVQMAGRLSEPKVTGTLVMGHTELHVPESGGGTTVRDVTLSEEDRLILARHFGVRALARVDRPVELLDPFTLDLELHLPEQVWFRRAGSPKIDVEITGSLRLRHQPHEEMGFFGTVEPLPGRSTLDLFGRTFELTDGEIILDGPVDQTRMRVTAQYTPPIDGVSDGDAVVIEVVARGRTDSLALDFSSNPTMPREDIVSYIVTGRPASDNPLVSSGGTGMSAENVALGQLSDAVGQVVSENLGFDVFQLQLDGSSGMTLTAGRYLTPKFFVSLHQPLQMRADATASQPSTALGPGFELQYRLATWLRINLQGGSLPAGVRLRGRYAY